MDWDDEQRDDHDDGTPTLHLQTHDGERRGSPPTQRVLQRNLDLVPLRQPKALSDFSGKLSGDDDDGGARGSATEVSDVLLTEAKRTTPPRREMQGARARTLRAVHILTVIRPRLPVPARKTLPKAHAPARLVHGREGREGKTSPVSKHITTGRTGACLGKDPHDHHPQADATQHGGRKDPGKSDHHRRADRADATHH